MVAGQRRRLSQTLFVGDQSEQAQNTVGSPTAASESLKAAAAAALLSKHRKQELYTLKKSETLKPLGQL